MRQLQHNRKQGHNPPWNLGAWHSSVLATSADAQPFIGRITQTWHVRSDRSGYLGIGEVA